MHSFDIMAEQDFAEFEREFEAITVSFLPFKWSACLTSVEWMYYMQTPGPRPLLLSSFAHGVQGVFDCYMHGPYPLSIDAHKTGVAQSQDPVFVSLLW